MANDFGGNEAGGNSELSPVDVLPAPIAYPPARIDDHCDAAVDRLADQFRRKPRIEALLCGVVDQLQDIEAATHGLIGGRSLRESTGATLDLWGVMLGLSRPLSGVGASDPGYRALLYGQTIIHTSHGEPGAVLGLLRTLGATHVRMTELRSATLLLDITGSLITSLPDTRALLVQATAPVDLGLTLVTAHPFGFDGDPDAYGFGDGELSQAF